MDLVVTIVHILTCILLILVVLLQAGKGASLGAAFGGASQTVFGSAGATPFLAKLTTALAILFMLTSLGLSVFFRDTSMPSIMEQVKQEAPAPAQKLPPAPSAPAQAQKKPAQDTQNKPRP